MAWVFLAGAILVEVGSTLSLRMAVLGSKKWYLPVIAGYLVSFVLLSFALGEGLGIGIAYGIWAASGVALVAMLSRVLFKEPLTWIMTLGMVLIVGGVLLIETGATH
ncbi:MAG TPA: SMR family transporter [Pseudolysinimonas sp.]|nr:SMR family transporter [Pseudolysinimonas sp.]